MRLLTGTKDSFRPTPQNRAAAGRGLRRKALLWFLTSALVAAACGGGSDAEADLEAGPEPSAGCEADASSGVASGTRTLGVGGEDRSYFLYVPSTLDAASPAPLVLNHHGLLDTPSGQVARSGFNDVAERVGAIVAYPRASRGAWDMTGDDDVEFISAVIDEVAASACVDLRSVYAIGMSQGGGLSTLLACRLPDRIAAVASVTVLDHHSAPACPNPHPAAVVAFVGTADTIYSIEAGLTIDVPDPDPPGPLAEETAAWVETNGCDPQPTETAPADGVVKRHYECDGDAVLSVYIHPGGHTWPTRGTEGIDANSVIWEFLTGHSGRGETN